MRGKSPARWIWLLVFLLVLFSGRVITLYTDFLWFQEVDYSNVFWTTLGTKSALFAAGALALFLLLWGNVKIARRPTTRLPWVADNYLEIPERHQLVPVVHALLRFGIVALSLFAGAVWATRWEDALRFLHPEEFGKQDPLFGKGEAMHLAERHRSEEGVKHYA